MPAWARSSKSKASSPSYATNMPGANKRLVWSPAAQKDLREIWRYYANAASLEIADRLLRDIGEAARRIQQRPLTGRTRDEVMPGLRSILVHPYVIFYRP